VDAGVGPVAVVDGLLPSYPLSTQVTLSGQLSSGTRDRKSVV